MRFNPLKMITGAVNGLLGGGGGGGGGGYAPPPPAPQITQVPNRPAWVEKEWENLYKRAAPRAGAGKPEEARKYEQNPYLKFAPQTAEHKKAIEFLKRPNELLPQFRQGREDINALRNQNFSDLFKDFSSPYLKNVYEPFANKINEEAGEKLAQHRRGMLSNGSRGSANAALAEAQLEKGRLGSLGELQAQLFPMIAKQYEGEQERKRALTADSLKALAVENELGKEDIDKLFAASEAEEGRAQSDLDLLAHEWEAKRNFEDEQIAYLQALLAGHPATRGAATISQAYGPQGTSSQERSIQKIGDIANIVGTLGQFAGKSGGGGSFFGF